MDQARLNIQQRKILGKSLVLSLCGIRQKELHPKQHLIFYMNLLY